MSDVKWIRLTVDMFDNRKIKHIRKLPEGNNIVLIWVMLLTMAGRTNANGFIFLTENILYTTKMLADELEFDESVIVMALAALENFGMLERDGDLLSVPGWELHQNIDGLEKVREQNRKRVAEHRKRQREQMELLDCNVTSNVTVTEGNADVTHQNKNKIKNKNYKEIKDIVEQSPTAVVPVHTADDSKYPYKDIVDYLNMCAGTAYKDKSKDTRKHIHARIDEGYSLADFHTVIEKKVAEWKGTDMEKYLRPATLFGSKFESYLNQKVGKAQSSKAVPCGMTGLQAFMAEGGENNDKTRICAVDISDTFCLPE